MRINYTQIHNKLSLSHQALFSTYTAFVRA